MTETAIRVQRLGKRYHLGRESRTRYRTLREELLKLPERMQAFFRARPHAEADFWALHEVSFEVNRGEVLGVIGRNGAGKSTLLKILSRITQPTAGQVDIFGRVGSLLEVGTGFHPELTGRENIFLSGAMLGMRRHEVRAHFDEIVAFAEVERFLDTPCKHYSSGMYTRLGFAVAAHLNTDILLVDEVLAVGDAEFQRRCLGKMSEVASSGRTVLFVSHQLQAVASLCSQGILLERGGITHAGPIGSTLLAYRRRNETCVESIVDVTQHERRVAGSETFFRDVCIRTCKDDAIGIAMGEGFIVDVRYDASSPFHGLKIGLIINDVYGRRLINLATAHQAPRALADAPAKGWVRCEVPFCNLIAGRYRLSVVASDAVREIDRVDDCLEFEILSRDVFGTGRIPEAVHGVVFVDAKWSVRAEATRRE